MEIKGRAWLDQGFAELADALKASPDEAMEAYEIANHLVNSPNKAMGTIGGLALMALAEITQQAMDKDG